MSYSLFLIDLDDTLLNFRESERLSFYRTMEHVGLKDDLEQVYASYQQEDNRLWQMLEEAKTTIEDLKISRFQRTFAAHGLEFSPHEASEHYLANLPQNVVLMDHAVEICEWLADKGEIGIVTNGIEHVQMQRIQNSALAPHISFVCVSDVCGYAKPDVRFFEHSATMAKSFDKRSTIVIGDRPNADIQGAHNFGVDSCWFNPHRLEAAPNVPAPTYEVAHLSELRNIL